MPAPKKPQDRQRPKAERENESFEWEHDGQTITLPPAKKIKAGVIRRASKQASEVGQIFAIFEEIVDADTLAVMDDMELDELGDMFMAWQEHGGASLGES